MYRLCVDGLYLSSTETACAVLCCRLWPVCLIQFFSIVQQPLVGQRILIFEALRSHLDTAYSIGLLWSGDQSDAETST